MNTTLIAYVLLMASVILISMPVASAEAQPCPDPVANPREFIECIVSQTVSTHPIGITDFATAVSRYATVAESPSGYCGFFGATEVNHHGAIFDYSWEDGFAMEFADGSTGQGPHRSMSHDSAVTGGDSQHLNGLNMRVGDTIVAYAAISNNDLGFAGLDSSFQTDGYTCVSAGVILPITKEEAVALVLKVLGDGT